MRRDYDSWVQDLATSHKRPHAKQRLQQVGAPAVPAIRRGLRHRNVMVRRLCTSLLDRLVDADSLPDLVAALDDVDVEVRTRALHALACERCKENACLPGEELFVPRALELLGEVDADLRAAAINALGRTADRRPDVAAALTRVRDSDPNVHLRSLARRWVP